MTVGMHCLLAEVHPLDDFRGVTLRNAELNWVLIVFGVVVKIVCVEDIELLPLVHGVEKLEDLGPC